MRTLTRLEHLIKAYIEMPKLRKLGIEKYSYYLNHKKITIILNDSLKEKISWLIGDVYDLAIQNALSKPDLETFKFLYHYWYGEHFDNK